VTTDGDIVDTAPLTELMGHLRELKRLNAAFTVLARAEKWDAIAGVERRRTQVVDLICDWLTLHDDWEPPK